MHSIADSHPDPVSDSQELAVESLHRAVVAAVGVVPAAATSAVTVHLRTAKAVLEAIVETEAAVVGQTVVVLGMGRIVVDIL